jgi:hypothetical protein
MTNQNKNVMYGVRNDYYDVIPKFYDTYDKTKAEYDKLAKEELYCPISLLMYYDDEDMNYEVLERSIDWF